MSDDKSEDFGIEIAANEGGRPTIKVNGLLRPLDWIFRRRRIKDQTAKAMIARLAEAGVLTPHQQDALQWSLGNEELKFRNVEKVREQIFVFEPKLKELAAHPPALPSSDQQLPIDVEVDLEGLVEQQAEKFFWDQFWSDAERASVSYVQQLLGQIGARKTTDSNSFSLRTLDVVRCLEPHHAEMLQGLSAYFFEGGLVPAQSGFKDEYVRIGLTTPGFVDLQDAGLLVLEEIRYDSERFELANGYVVRTHLNDNGDSGHKAWAMVMMLTRAGRELAALSLKNPDERQLKRLVRELVATGGCEYRGPTDERWHRWTGEREFDLEVG